MQERETQYGHHYAMQHHLPPPHAHSMRSAADSSSNSTKITDYVTNHEIKFTKTEGCTPSTCVCVFMAILFVSIAATSGIYFGLRSYDGRMLRDRVFKGQFTITRGESYSTNYENPDSQEFQSAAKNYANKLDKLYNDSHYAKAFNRSEIIALEKRKTGGDDVIVHFNLHLAAQRPDIDAADLFVILGDEILNGRKGLFKNVTIDYDTIDIQERRLSRASSALTSAFLRNPWEQRARFPGLLEGLSTEPTPPPRKCYGIGLQYCNSLSYNKTSYPNVVNHWNITSVEDDFIMYRQIIDFECYPLAREFVCRVLQPECADDEMIYPCRDFCEDFFKSCESWIPKKLLNKFNCNLFPTGNEHNRISVNEDDDNSKKVKKCKAKPGCSNELYTLGLSSRVCDGIVDCHDYSDENYCDYCKRNQFYCGYKECIDISLRCDGNADCMSGADEYGCVYLSENFNGKVVNQISQKVYYLSRGFLQSEYKGQQKKVCAESFYNTSITLNKPNNAVQRFASMVCQQLNFGDVQQYETRSDTSNKGSFVEVNDIGTHTVKLKETPCNSRQILHVQCNGSLCGLNPSYVSIEKRIADSRGAYLSEHTDWPWYGFLTRESQYACDVTLITPEWLITSFACFNDQQPSKTIAMLGSARINRNSPIGTEEREITALVHSTNNNDKGRLTLVRLERPVNTSNYIRPVCLHNGDGNGYGNHMKNMNCVTLAWDMKGDRLEFMRANIVHSDECISSNGHSYDSDMSEHNWCVKLVNYKDEGCHGCGIPGRPLYCHISSKWYLIGIENAFYGEQNKYINGHLQWYSKVSLLTNWASQIMHSFAKQT